jgi:tRNA(fMet)-specific endonuclease VapC
LSLWILDTDHLSLAQRGHIEVSNRLLQANPSQTAITIITVEEQLRGRFQIIRQSKSPSDLIRAYKNLLITFDSLKTFNVLEFSHQAYTIYDSSASQFCRWRGLRPRHRQNWVLENCKTEMHSYDSLVNQKIRIGKQDLRIGAIALSTNAIVVTRNQRDFSQIPGLMLEDWTIL